MARRRSPPAAHMCGSSATRANSGGSGAEVYASGGSRIRPLPGRLYGVRYPTAIGADSADSWVTNDPQTGNGRTSKPDDGSVTELNASDGSFCPDPVWRSLSFQQQIG